MPNVQIRDVPEDVHAALVRRATLAGQSLQQFLAAQLVMLAATPTLDEVLARIELQPKGRITMSEIVASIRDDRDRR